MNTLKIKKMTKTIFKVKVNDTFCEYKFILEFPTDEIGIKSIIDAVIEKYGCKIIKQELNKTPSFKFKNINNATKINSTTNRNM